MFWDKRLYDRLDEVNLRLNTLGDLMKRGWDLHEKEIDQLKARIRILEARANAEKIVDLVKRKA